MHQGHRLRLKKRFLEEGLASFEEHEVLELLLFYAIPQGDTNPIAHRLIDKFFTLSGVFNASVEELCTVKGIKEHSAILIKMMAPLLQYMAGLTVKEKTVIKTSYDAGKYVCAMIGYLPREVFAVICMDAQRNVLAFEILEEGTVAQANVSPRKVAECAIRHNATSVILAHNHPSGSLSASENDRILTARLCDMLESMEVQVVDHIIASGQDKYLSMADGSLMPN